MIFPEKKDFLHKSGETLSRLYDRYSDLPDISLDNFPPHKTMLFIIDLVNGFADSGVLYSERIKALVPATYELMKKCDVRGIKTVAFADCHTAQSAEFEHYPPHCLDGSPESELVEEIRQAGAYTLIKKNSTNGFLSQHFQEIPGGYDHFIIAGDCTDICVLQFSTTLKAHFNEQNKKVKIVVPLNLIDTYDFDLHDGDLLNVMSLYLMEQMGIALYKNIT